MARIVLVVLFVSLFISGCGSEMTDRDVTSSALPQEALSDEELSNLARKHAESSIKQGSFIKEHPTFFQEARADVARPEENMVTVRFSAEWPVNVQGTTFVVSMRPDGTLIRIMAAQ